MVFTDPKGGGDVKGVRVGPYELRTPLGTGGLGLVYEARHVGTGRIAAVKLLKRHGRRALARLRREVDAISSVVDRHVVRLVSADLEGPTPYLAMTLVSGSTLKEILHRRKSERPGAFPLAETATWSRDVACALAAAHRSKVVHRDLKPDNVMVDTEGRAVVIDFGLAWIDAVDHDSLTRSRQFIGTPRYLTPEQLTGRTRSPRSDVYQWGLLVHEMLAGAGPYADLEPLQAVQLRCVQAPPIPRAPDQLSPLARLVHRCLSVDALDRPRDGVELLSVLEMAEDLDTPAPPRATGVACGMPPPDPGSREMPTGSWDVAPRSGLAREIAERLGAHRVVRLVGQGGMGVVYEVQNRSSGQRAAIKIIHPGLSVHSEIRRRFRREAELLMKLTSPRIVRLIDYGQLGERLFLLMEYVDGETVAARLLRCGGLPFPEALAILEGVTEGVRDLHREGIIHRDLKPANIIITALAGPRVVDLGLAIGVGDTRITESGSVIGTPFYAPPEALKGYRSLVAADIFALGTLLYELVTGRVDFRVPDAPTLLMCSLLGEPRLHSTAGRSVAKDIVRLFERATALDPAGRHPAAERFLWDVERAIHGFALLGAVGELTMSYAPRCAAPPTVRPVALAPVPTDEQSRTRPILLRRVVAAVIAVVIICWAGVVAWLLVGSRKWSRSRSSGVVLGLVDGR